MPLGIDPGSADEIAPALRDYLSQRLGRAVAFAEPPQELTGGRSTFVYSFRLEPDSDLDDSWAGPLVLRVFPLAEQVEMAEQEATVQKWVVDKGYPAPRVLAVETELAHVGRPFIVMERLPGIPLADKIGPNLQEAYRLAERIGELQAELHRLPTADVPLPYERPAIDSVLDDFQEKIDTYSLRHFQRAHKVLDEHRAIAIPEEPVICHNDFHPLNLIIDDDGNMGVIDWEGAALADRHCGVAWTMLTLTTPLLPPRNPLEGVVRGISSLFQPRFAQHYLDRYQQEFELDPLRLCYWQAVRAFGLWLQISVWKTAPRVAQQVGADRRSAGGKPDNAQYWPRETTYILRDYVRERFQEMHSLS